MREGRCDQEEEEEEVGLLIVLNCMGQVGSSPLEGSAMNGALPPTVHAHLKPQNRTSSGNGVFADAVG